MLGFYVAYVFSSYILNLISRDVHLALVLHSISTDIH